MNDDVFIGCVPVADGGIVAVGSVKTKCVTCATAVWIAPSGVKIVKTKGARPTCLRCVAAKIAEDGDPEIQPMTAEQLDEAVRTLLLQARRN